MADISKINVNNTEYNVKDATARSKQIIEGQASGSIATFSDGGDNIPMKSCEVAIVAQQASGTPSPSNPLPITGFSSVNLLQNANNMFFMEFLKGSGITLFDGVASGTASNFYNNFGVIAGISQVYEHFKPNTQYTISWKAYTTASVSSANLGLIVGIQYTDNTNDTVAMPNNTNSYTQFSIVSNASKTIKRMFLSFSTGGANTWYLKEVQINEGTTIETYQSPTVYPVSLGQTIYGGTAELVGGNGTKTFGYVDLGSLSWTYTGGKFLATVSDAITPVSGGDTSAICEIYNRVAYSSSIADLSFYLCANQLSLTKYLTIRDDSYNGDTNAFKTGVTGKKIVFTLETPTAFTFTGANIPTLSGVNNVYADSGDVDLEYFNENADEIAELIRVLTQ